MNMDDFFHELSGEIKNDSLELIVKRLKEAGVSDQMEASSVTITTGMNIMVDGLRSLNDQDRPLAIETTVQFFHLTMALLASE